MTEFKELKLSDLVASSTNPRSEFEENSLKELAESIKAHGVLQPIIARIHPEQNKKYEVVCGERRFRATKIAGVKTIPVSIRELNDDEVFEIQIIENLERKDVHPLDEAVAFKRMLESGKYTIEDIAAKVAKNLTFVAQRLKLNDLIPELKQDFLKGEFGVGHAVLLCRVSPEKQDEIFQSSKDKWNPGFGTVRELKEDLEEDDLDLETAKFDTTDPLLFPEAGACNMCPKNSRSNPVLFPDYEENKCFDNICFKTKTERFQINELQKIIDENPGIQLVCNYGEPDEHLGNVATSNGKTVLNWNCYNGSSEDNQDSVQAFNLVSWQLIWIRLTSQGESKGVTNSADQNISLEIANIKQRADRALELDREKIYKRAMDELIKNKEKNEVLSSEDDLTLNEKIALCTNLIPYSDEDWIMEKYGVGRFEYRRGKLDFIKDNYSDQLLFKLIRNHLKSELVSEGILDYEKNTNPGAYMSILKDYFPSEIELYTLEQTAIAEKRIARSDARIKVLQDELDGKTDAVKRCTSCKKSDDDYLEEVGVPAMWKGDLCIPCSTKSQKFESEQKCRICGCTENDCSQCIEKTGFPCSWVEVDLCSACVEILDAEFESIPDVNSLPTFEKITRKSKFSLNNSYFKNCNSQTEPSTPYEVMGYFKQHGELPFAMDPEQNQNWLYDTYIEYQKRAGVFGSQFFTPPATANRMAEIASEYFDEEDPNILDACCGFGMLTKPLLNSDFIVSGFDINTDLISIYEEYAGCVCDVSSFADYKVHNKYKYVISNPPYEVPVMKEFFMTLADSFLEDKGKAILLLPKGFMDKDKPAPLVWQLEKFNIIHREDMTESFARTAINAEIVVLEKS